MSSQCPPARQAGISDIIRLLKCSNPTVVVCVCGEGVCVCVAGAAVCVCMCMCMYVPMCVVL